MIVETQTRLKTPDSTSKSVIQALRRIGPMPFMLILMIIVFQFQNDRFLSNINIMNMGQQSVFLMLIALGQMIVLISGGFDLSVGAVVALTSVVTAKMMIALGAAFPDSPTIVIVLGACGALVLGAVCGLINGLGVAFLKVNAFIVTLATASIFKGVTLVISQGVQVSGLPSSFVFGIGSGRLFGIPSLILMTILPVVAVYLMMHRMRFGRYLYSIGSNMRAAVAAGVSVNKHLLGAYMICSMLTAYAGWLLTARVSSGEPLLGAEFPLNSIAAAVIGGCSLRGGEGRTGGVILGVAFIIILSNGMDLMRVGSNYQMIALGVVLVGAVVLDRYRTGSQK